MGYVTEKIFNCFAAGCVPIYWGAPNVTDYIPKNCFIDRRDFGSNAEVYDFIKSMSQGVYETYLKNIQIFLDSDQARLFARDHYVPAHISMILDAERAAYGKE